MTHNQKTKLNQWIETQHGSAGWEVKLENLIDAMLEEQRAEILLELLQRFNDYEVPILMSAEQVRELLDEFMGEQNGS